MKSSIVTFVLLLGSMSLWAQTERRIYTSAEKENHLTDEERSAKRASQKRQQALNDSIDFAKALQAIESLDFVLEADRASFKRGESLSVSTITNFISVSDDQAVIQVSPVYAGGGPNGVGGITLKGTGSGFKLKTDKKGNVVLHFSVNGVGLSATVTLSMSRGSNRAIATVSPNYHSNTVTLSGWLVPLPESRVYEGISPF